VHLGANSTFHDQNTKWEKSTLFALNKAEEDFGGRLPAKESRFIWLDYFCLKQCQSDFDTGCTIELIEDIGSVLSAIDSNFDYVNRSFCILELYGAFKGGANLMCMSPLLFTKEEMRKVLAVERTKATYSGREGDYWFGPINVAAAQTRRLEDKNAIDSFIQQLPGGFDFVNRIVTEKLIESSSGE